MSVSAEVYGHSFEIQATATTTEARFDWNTGIAYVAGDAVLRPRKVTIKNDSATINLEYLLNSPKSATSVQHVLLPGETITHNVISRGLWVESASSTVAFRAWGEG